MPDLEAQRAALDSEFYWFGGQLGAPKVYDSGTSFSVAPTLRGATRTRWVDDQSGAAEGVRVVTYTSTETHWNVSVEEA